MLTIPPLEKIVSRSSKMRNTNAMTNSSSSLTNIETRADKNGDGLVYHRSDCGYPRVRVYGGGGDWSGSYCGYWQDALIPYNYIPLYSGEGITFTRADVVWFGVYNNDSGLSMLTQSYENLKNKNGGGGHNWTDDEITKITCNAIGICKEE